MSVAASDTTIRLPQPVARDIAVRHCDAVVAVPATLDAVASHDEVQADHVPGTTPLRSSQRPSGDRIRVLLADDHAIVRESLGRLLVQPGLEVVGLASDGQHAVNLAADSSRT